MQTLVIGDIHGCYHELQALLDKAGLVDGNHIISLGDCVDRGPETPEVLRFFKEYPNARLVMGNHERKHVRASRGEVKLAISQRISIMQFGESYPGTLDFMSTLPLYIELPEALLVHGYLEPGIPLHEQLPTVLCGTMGGEKHLRAHYNRPWYEFYDGEKPVLVGHKNYTETDQPFVYHERVFGLDTSCVTGKALTGILLPAFRFVSVPSRGNLWMQVRCTLPRPAKPARPKSVPVQWSANDKKTLAGLVEKVSQACTTLMDELQSQPGFMDLRPRQQALLFGSKAGTGRLASLMHLARLGKLDMKIARKVAREPANLDALLSELQSPT